MNFEISKRIIYEWPIFRKLFSPALAIKRLLIKHQEKVYDNLCELLIDDPVIKIDEFSGIFTIDCRSDYLSE